MNNNKVTKLNTLEKNFQSNFIYNYGNCFPGSISKFVSPLESVYAKLELTNKSDFINYSINYIKFNNNDKVCIIANAQNLGFTKGNNRVIEMILKDYPDVEYIALLNNDTKVEIEWLSNLVKSAKTNEADIVSSKMINYFNQKLWIK